MSGTVSAKLPDDLEEAVKAYSKEHDLNRSAAVRQLTRQGLQSESRHPLCRPAAKLGEISLIVCVLSILLAFVLAEPQLYSFSGAAFLAALSSYSISGFLNSNDAVEGWT